MGDSQNRIQRSVAIASLSWLGAANLVGLLLALLLLWPAGNELLAPLTYGRWIPLHMDWQLYGWCSLPLLGTLLGRFFEEETQAVSWVETSLWLWSMGLLAGGLSWLSGSATGKPFLNWTAWGGLAFAGAQGGIWMLLALSWGRGARLKWTARERMERVVWGAKGLALAVLLAVPFVLLWSSHPEVYPPVNPHSGGATGHSLLASTLSLVFIMALVPQLLLRKTAKGASWIARLFWAIFAVDCLVYLFIGHGDASNRGWDQVLGLGTLLVWPLLLGLYWNRFEWRSSSRLWRWAFLAWWGLLALDGWGLFLPGVLDVLKFTNALVAHSHLAMAGMVTCFNACLLVEMGSSRLAQSSLARPWAFFLWNGGCLLYVAAMTWQGLREGEAPGVLFAYDELSALSYGIRFVAGLMMAVSNGYWLLSLLRTREGALAAHPLDSRASSVSASQGSKLKSVAP